MTRNFVVTRKRVVGKEEHFESMNNTRILFYKNVLISSEAGNEIEIATNRITTMFLNFRQI